MTDSSVPPLVDGGFDVTLSWTEGGSDRWELPRRVAGDTPSARDDYSVAGRASRAVSERALGEAWRVSRDRPDFERHREGSTGTAGDHRRLEPGSRRATLGADDDHGGDRYGGPLFVYRGGRRSLSSRDELRADHRTGPINVVWQAGERASGDVTAAWVKERMEEAGGWTSPVPTRWVRERYVPLDTGRDGRIEMRPATAEVQKQLRVLNPFEQYHVRLYDVQEENPRYPVVGQAHWDPTTHDWPVPFTDSPGRFVESRQAVLSTWRSLEYETKLVRAVRGDSTDQQDGGAFGSADGRIGVVILDH